MKFIMKLFGGLFLLLVLGVGLFLGYLGMMPGLSSLMGTDKPRDLGTTYSEADLKSIHQKSQVVYQVLPDSTIASESRRFSGSHAFSGEFSAAEITATANNQPWKHWPYQNMQFKFNSDGSVEASGQIIKAKLPSYAAAIGIPAQAVDVAMKFLPSDPVFYVKGRGALTENQVSLFEPQKFEIGRLALPLNLLLSHNRDFMVGHAYAQDLEGLKEELSKVSDKRSLIVGYINSRLSAAFGDFYAKKAYFINNAVHFEGTLSDISYSR